MLDRRELLLAGALALVGRAASAQDREPMSFTEICARIEDYPRFFTLAELQQRVDSLHRRYPSVLTRRVIGSSKRGLPIELISIGEGARSALIVAGLHPNEQVGGLTADFMMSELCRNDALRRGLGFTWHFINPVDPDGMRLNEGWLRAPLTLESYLTSLFRPALARQAEYTFPLQAGAWSFADSPPENRAWREALALTKPALQYTQHNADYGGAFFLTSAGNPVLERQLQALPARHGVGLSRVGEPLAELDVRAEGIFALPMPTQMLKRFGASRSAEEMRRVWSAGDSSTSYAQRYGTFSLSTEVPMWDDARLADQGPSDVTVGNVLSHFMRWGSEANTLIGRWEPQLSAEMRQTELFHSLAEHVQNGHDRLSQLNALLSSGKPDRLKLSVADAATYATTLRMSVLRPVAYLAQLARQQDAQLAPAADQCHAFIVRHLAELRAEAQLRPLPLRSLVAIQMAAGLHAAEAVSRGR